MGQLWQSSPKSAKILFVSIGLAISLSSATYIPFMFWGTRASTSAGDITISMNTTITDANYTTYENKNVTINSGIIVTVEATVPLSWYGLTMNTSSQITPSACTTSVCYPLRLNIATDASIASGASINADGKGYLGGDTSSYPGRTLGNTQTGAATALSGGSYGGYGGNHPSYVPNEIYGSVTQPVDMGSGGGSYTTSYAGTNGGGAIKLTVNGSLTLSGTITSNGVTPPSQRGGCGSGGSIWVSAGSINGAGAIRANGGGHSSYCYAGGGGGRVAIYYGTLSTFSVTSSTYVQTTGGVASANTGGSGTIYSKSMSQANGDLFIHGTNVSTYGSTRWGAFGLVNSVSGSTLNMTTTTDPRNMKLGLSIAGATLRPDVSQSNVTTLSGSTATALTASASIAALTSAGKAYCVTDYEAVFDNVRIEGNQRVRVGCLTVVQTLSMPGTGRLDGYLVDVQNANLSGAITFNTLEKMSTTVPGGVVIGSGSTFSTKYFAGGDFSSTSSTLSFGSNFSGTAVSLVSSPATFSGSLTGSSFSASTSNFSVTGAANFTGPVTISSISSAVFSSGLSAGDMSVTSSTVPVTGAISLSSDLTLASSSTLSTTTNLTAGNVTGTSSTLNVTGAGTIAGGSLTSMTVNVGTSLSAITSSVTVTLSTVTVGTTFSVATDLLIKGTSTTTGSTVSALTYTVGGSMTLNGSSTAKIQDATIVGDLSLTNTTKIIAFDPSTTAVYPIRITAANASIPSGTSIDADGKGYLGGDTSSYPGRTLGNTQTGAATALSGGSYGGYGGNHPSYVPNEIYGSVTQPVDMGSGGGSYTTSYAGTNGGGAIKLTVTGVLAFGGTISSNGVTPPSQRGGCGSGGSVWVNANSITGSGLMRANGGSHSSYCYAGGGGGRVAVYYGTLSTFSVTNSAYVQALGGAASANTGGSGTIYSKATSQVNGDLFIHGTTVSTYGSTRWGAFGLVNSVSGSTLNMTTSADPRNMKLGLSLAGSTLRPDISQSNTTTLNGSTATALTSSASLTGLTSAGKAYCVTDYEVVFDNVRIEGSQRVRVGCLKVTQTLSMPGTGRLDAYTVETDTSTISGSVTVSILDQSTSPTMTLGASSNYSAKYFVGTDFTATNSTINIAGPMSVSNINVTGSTMTVSGALTALNNVAFTSTNLNVTGSVSIAGTLSITNSPNVAFGAGLSAGPTTISASGVTVTGAGTIAGDLSVLSSSSLSFTSNLSAYNVTVTSSSLTVGGNLTGLVGNLSSATVNVTGSSTLTELVATSSTLTTGTSLSISSSSATLTLSTVTVGTVISVATDLLIKGTTTANGSTVSALTYTVGGNMTLNGSSTVKLQDGTITGDLVLTNTSKIIAHDPLTTAVYPIRITAANASIPSGTSIDADGKGYLGGDTSSYPGRTLGNTQTGASTALSGGSHGGYGGNHPSYVPNELYGSVTQPIDMGSGGGSYTTSYAGTNGGGAIKLTITGTLTFGGTITANGVTPPSQRGGCGAGGSIWVSANNITGSGLMRANGGSHSSYCYAGGGGGRVAVYYGTLTTFSVTSSTYVQALGGAASANTGGSGTIYSKATSQVNGDLFVHGTTVSTYGSTRWGAFGLVNSISGSTLNMTTSADPRNMKLGLSLASGTLRPDVTQSTVTSLTSGTSTSLVSATSLAGLTSAGKAYCVTDYEAVFDNVRIEGNQRVRVGCLNIIETLSMPGTGRLDAYSLNSATSTLSGSVTVNVLDNYNSPSLSLGSGSSYSAKNFVGTNFTATNSTILMTGYISVNNFNVTGSTVTVASYLTATDTFVLGTSSLTVGGNLSTGPASITGSTMDITGATLVAGTLSIASSPTVILRNGLTAGATTITGSGVTLIGNGNISGNLSIASSTVNVTGAGTVNGDLSVTSSSIFNLTSHLAANAITVTSSSMTIGGNLSGLVTNLNGATVNVTGTVVFTETTLTASTLTGSSITTTSPVTTFTTSTVTATTNLSVSSDLLIKGTTTANGSTVSALTYTVGGNMTLNGTSTAKLQDATITGDLVMSNTSKIIAYDPLTTAVYPIRITAANASIPSGTSIDADGKGYLGGDTSSYPGRTLGNTQTGASTALSGGSYGGYGGNHPSYVPNELYGSVTQPVDMGSGGGSYTTSYAGTNGGGAIKLTIAGTLTFGGTITANGVTPPSQRGGCGSGGSVWVSANSITGSGLIRANGGSHSSYCYAGGGGGRVAVYYGSLTTFSVTSSTYVQAIGGAASANTGGSGTIYSKSISQTNGDLFVHGTTVSTYGSTRWGAFGLVSSVSGSTLNMTTSADPRNMKLGLSLAGSTLRPDVSQSNTTTLSGGTATALTSSTSITALTSAGKAFCVTDYETVFDNVRIEGNQNVRVGCLKVTQALTMPGTGRLDSYLLEFNTGSISGAATLNNLEAVATTIPGSLTLGSGSSLTTKSFTGDSVTATSANISSTSGFTSGEMTLTSTPAVFGTTLSAANVTASNSNFTVTGAANIASFSGTNIPNLRFQSTLDATGSVSMTGTTATVTGAANLGGGLSLLGASSGTFSNAVVVGGNLTLTSSTLTVNNSGTFAGANVSSSTLSIGNILSTTSSAATFTLSTVTATSAMSIATDLLIQGSTTANGSTVSALTYTVGGNMTLNGSSTVKLQDGTITGDLVLTNTSKIIAHDPLTTAVYPIRITAANASIPSGTSIDTDGKGYLGGDTSSYPGRTLGNTQTGASTALSGGSHGGYGGNHPSYVPNELYGSVTQPVDMGSGGGSYTTSYAGTNGGGAIKLAIAGTLTFGGTLTANGVTPPSQRGGCGAGGSIWVSANSITGSGLMRANGGSHSSYCYAGGGGGRVAVYYGTLTTFSVTSSTYVQALGGAASANTGGSGTIYSKATSQVNGDLFIHGANVSTYGSTRWGAFGLVNSVSSGTLNMTTSADPRNMKLGLSIVGSTLRPDTTQSNVVTLNGSSATTLTSPTALTGLTSAGKSFCVTDYETVFDNVRIEGAQNVRVGCMTVTTSYTKTSTGTVNAYLLTTP